MDDDRLGARNPVTPRLPTVAKSLGAVSLLNDLASEMVYPMLPALVTRLGGGAVTLGALDGVSDAAAAVAKLWSGWVADVRGWRRALVVAGYGIAAVARPLMAVAGAGWQVVTLRTVDRLGKGVRAPPRDAVIADATPPPLRGRAFGLQRGMDHAGATLGPLLAAALVTVAGFSPGRVIAWSVLPGVLAAGLAWVALRGMASSRVQDPPGGAPVPRAAAAPPAAGTSPPVVALVVLFALVRMPETLFLLRLQDLGLAIGVVPLLWASLHVVRTAASYPGGWVTDRSGPLRTMLAGWLLYAVVCAGLAQAGTPGQGIAWFLALGLVAGATESSERTFIAQLGGPARRGRAFGAYHATVGLAALPGGILLGLVYARWAGPAALRVSAAATAAIAVLGLLVARRRAPG